MNRTEARRRALLLAGAGMVSLSGCVGGDDGPDGGSDDETETASPKTPESQDTESPTAKPTSTATATRTETGRSTADPVDEAAAATLIEDARSEVQSAFDRLSRDDTDNGRVETHVTSAVDSLSTANRVGRKARAARSRLESLDESVVDSFDRVDYRARLDDTTTAVSFTANASEFAGGHAEGSVGWLDTSLGLAEVTRENWSAARSAFEDARAQFENASDSYAATDREFVYEVRPVLEPWFELIRCEVETGVEMSDHFLASVDAATAGDEETRQAELEAGFSAPDECRE